MSNLLMSTPQFLSSTSKSFMCCRFELWVKLIWRKSAPRTFTELLALYLCQWRQCSPPSGSLYFNGWSASISSHLQAIIKRLEKKLEQEKGREDAQMMISTRCQRYFGPHVRDACRYQNGWIFKSSKRPLTPTPHFRKAILRISRQNCDKKAYVH